MPVSAFADAGTDVRIDILDENVDCNYYSCNETRSVYCYVYTDDLDADCSVTSSDTSVVNVTGTDRYKDEYNQRFRIVINYMILKPGKASIRIESKGKEAEFKVFCHPEIPQIESIEVTGNKKLTLKWKKAEGVDGYAVSRFKEGSYDPADNVIKYVYGADTTSVEVDAPYYKDCYYYVTSFFSDGNEKVYNWGWSDFFEASCPVPGTTIRSVNVSGNNAVISWAATPGASGYEVYRSACEEDGYVKIGSVSGKVLSFTDKPKAGMVWHYGVRPVFSNGKGQISDTYTQMIPVKKAKKVSQVKNRKIKLSDHCGTTLYRDGNSLYYADGIDRGKGRIQIKIYRLGSNYKVKSSKTVKVSAGKSAAFKGFYHGPDGNNYVFVSYPNFGDKKTKVVARIIRYNKKWKRTGTASLKGGDGFGIGSACVIGRPAFSMRGNNLIIHTSRFHYIDKSDGLRHESNLTIMVDLKNMTASSGDISGSYASHSFAQKLRIKGDAIYLADLGDAYPRALQVCIGNSSLNSNEKQVEGTGAYETFKFRGKTGDNYTGTSLAGMEIGRNKIVITGSSVPHNHAVKGVKGMGGRQNLYANIIDKRTGKAKVVWLTQFHPKKSKQDVYSVSMVKLNENRFAILASISGRLHYYLIDENGKKIKHIKHKKSIRFAPVSNPVVYNGSIVWADEKETPAGKNYIRIVSIPVVL